MERYKYDEKSSYLVSDIISESGNDNICMHYNKNDPSVG